MKPYGIIANQQFLASWKSDKNIDYFMPQQYEMGTEYLADCDKPDISSCPSGRYCC